MTSSDPPADPRAHAFRDALRDVIGELGLNQAGLEQAVDPDGGRWLAHVGNGKRPLPASRLEKLLRWPGLTEDQRLRLRHADTVTRIARDLPRPLAHRFPRLTAAAVTALNFDHVVPLSRTRHTLKALPAFTWQPEHVVATQEELEQALATVVEALGPDAVTHVYGGSAYNVFRILADAGLRYPLGLVGVSGAAPAGVALRPHRACLGDAIDARLVAVAADPAGRCLSVVRARGDREVQRQMRTWPGANALLYAHLVDQFWLIVDYLASARLVMISSTLDLRSRDVLADIVDEVVKLRPMVTICFDPGDTWARRDAPAVRRLLGQTTMLFAAEGELVDLAANYARQGSSPTDHGDVMDEEPDYARRLLAVLRPDGAAGEAAVIVVKHRGATSQYRRNAPALLTQLDALAGSVEDDTGAGDAFTAGYLAVHLSATPDPTAAADLGMRLARAKLPRVGPPQAAQTRALARDVLGPLQDGPVDTSTRSPEGRADDIAGCQSS